MLGLVLGLGLGLGMKGRRDGHDHVAGQKHHWIRQVIRLMVQLSGLRLGQG